MLPLVNPLLVVLDLEPTSNGTRGAGSAESRASDVHKTLDLLHVDSLALPELAVDRLSPMDLI